MLLVVEGDAKLKDLKSIVSSEDCCNEVEGRRFQAKPRATLKHSNWPVPYEELWSTCGDSSFTSHHLLATIAFPLCRSLIPASLSTLRIAQQQDEHGEALEAPASPFGCFQASCLPSIRPETNCEAIPQFPNVV